MTADASDVISAPSCGASRQTPEATEALQDIVNALVSEKMEAMWHKGKTMIANLQREHADKIQSLTDELAACREECRELRAAVDRLRVGDCTLDVGAMETASASASGKCSLGSSVVSSPELKDGADTGPAAAATAAAFAAAAAAVPKMPGYLQVGSPIPAMGSPLPSLPPGMRYPFGPQSFAQPAGEQRPLSLADALADALPSKAASAPVLEAGGSAADKEAAALAAAYPGSLPFTVTLRKEGSSLGLNVSHDKQDRALRVEGVFPGTAAHAWNRAQAARGERTINVGDIVFSINGVTQDQQRMLQECREREVLTLTIVRRPAEVAAAKGATALRAEASEFVPMIGKVAQPAAAEDTT